MNKQPVDESPIEQSKLPWKSNLLERLKYFRDNPERRKHYFKVMLERYKLKSKVNEQQ